VADEYGRYARQIIFPGIGEDGQEKLLNARVALVGCGADGSLIADRLVRAGVGQLTIIDQDFLELNNLQRQFLYDEGDCRASLPKAVAAQRRLRSINSEVAVTGVVTDLNAANAEELLAGADLVMDGTDNPGARYIINDVCVKHDIPWVYCGVVASHGTVMTIVPHQTACLRCLAPDPPPSGSTETAAIVGIINPIVPAVAGIAVAEGLKLIVGVGERLEGTFRLDLWDNTIEVSEGMPPLPGCPCCDRGEYEFLEPESGDVLVKF
jgi:adenylyltransferase/sulfurtransferase